MAWRVRTGERPTFVTSRETGRVEDVARGLQWLLTFGDGTENALIIAPTKSQYSSGDLAEVLGSAARTLAGGGTVTAAGGRRIRGATQQTLRRLAGWRGGPVLLAWPDARAIADVADDPRVSAICVIPWVYDEVATWAVGTRAVNLSDRSDGPMPPTIEDPVVAAAMRSLTSRVNLSTGLLHPMDKAAAVEAFRILNRGRHTWEPAEIEAWAMAHGWSLEGATHLKNVAAGVAAGRRFQVHRGGSWNAQILKMWRAEAAKPTE
jgi:hypothetical protein